MAERQTELTPADRALQRFEAHTNRLEKLTAFVDRFVPAIGQRCEYGFEIEASETVNQIRDEAVRHAFAAINRIAQASFRDD